MATTTYGIYSPGRRDVEKGTTNRDPRGSNGVTQIRTSGPLIGKPDPKAGRGVD